MFWEEESPSGFFLVIVSVQAFFNSCFLLTAVIIPYVIHGLFCITRLVMRGVSRRHDASRVDSNKLVKSVKFSDGIIFVISDSRFLTNLVTLALEKL